MNRTDLDTDLLATGTIAGFAETFTATFTPSHRVGNDTPAVLACTVTMPLSFEDAIAALWVAAHNGTLREDMTGPDDLHAVVVYTLVNHNPDVATARRELDTVADGSPEWKAAMQLTMAVVRAYGNGTAPPAAPGATFSLLSPVVNPASNFHRAGAPNHTGRAGLRIVTD
jgi:hypothetical protein